MLNYNLFALTAEQIYECKLIINDQQRASADYNLHVRRRCAEVFLFNLLFFQPACAEEASEK